MNKLNHSNLRELASEANSLLSSCEDHVKRWYDIVIDSFYTKIYKEENVKTKKAPKHILPIFLHNKGLEHIKLSKILHNKDVLSKLPVKLQTEDPPSIVYKLSSTIRNKLFNFKDTVNNIDVTDTDTYGTKLSHCECHNSPFVDPDHGHIVTGDLRIITDQHLRKLISKGPNYREPRSINWKKCRETIDDGLESYISNICAKFNVANEDIIPWKDEVLQRIDEKITPLKRKVKFNKVNPILQRPDVIKYLENLHSKFVLVPIDKAANNVSIICKRFYVEVILNTLHVLDPKKTQEAHRKEVYHRF